MAYASVNPYSGECTKQYAESTSAEVEAFVSQAQACFDIWRTTSFADPRALQLGYLGVRQ